MKRTQIRTKRRTPRRRTAPRWNTAGWEEANDALLTRSGGLCECCGLSFRGRVERAHRVRRRDGGDRLSNLLLLHPDCHAWTHAHPLEAIERGLIVQTWCDPSTTPVLWQGTTWSLLADDGTRQPVDRNPHPESIEAGR